MQDATKKQQMLDTTKAVGREFILAIRKVRATLDEANAIDYSTLIADNDTDLTGEVTGLQLKTLLDNFGAIDTQFSNIEGNFINVVGSVQP